jgi:hypothetical protein
MDLPHKHRIKVAKPNPKALRAKPTPRDKLLCMAAGVFVASEARARKLVSKISPEESCIDGRPLVSAIIAALNEAVPDGAAANACCIDAYFQCEPKALANSATGGMVCDSQGLTPLMVAAAHRNGHAIRAILRHRASWPQACAESAPDGRRAIDFLPPLPEQPGLHAMLLDNPLIVLSSFPDDILRLILPYCFSHLGLLDSLGPRFQRLVRTPHVVARDPARPRETTITLPMRDALNEWLKTCQPMLLLADVPPSLATYIAQKSLALDNPKKVKAVVIVGPDSAAPCIVRYVFRAIQPPAPVDDNIIAWAFRIAIRFRDYHLIEMLLETQRHGIVESLVRSKFVHERLISPMVPWIQNSWTYMFGPYAMSTTWQMFIFANEAFVPRVQKELSHAIYASVLHNHTAMMQWLRQNVERDVLLAACAKINSPHGCVFAKFLDAPML